MKVRYTKVIFGLILLLSFAVPNIAAGMPADVELTPDSTQYIEIPLTALTDVDHLAPPATEVSAQIGCNKAVFVDEQNPATNMNGGANRAYLRVGIGPEFGGELWTLLSFSQTQALM